MADRRCGGASRFLVLTSTLDRSRASLTSRGRTDRPPHPVDYFRQRAIPMPLSSRPTSVPAAGRATLPRNWTCRWPSSRNGASRTGAAPATQPDWQRRRATPSSLTMRSTPGAPSPAAALRQRGARDVYACATHASSRPPLGGKHEAARLKELVVTNTVYISRKSARPAAVPAGCRWPICWPR